MVHNNLSVLCLLSTFYDIFDQEKYTKPSICVDLLALGSRSAIFR